MSRQHVEKLLDKARDAERADEAIKFSQAASNAAHAIQTLLQAEQLTPPVKAIT